MLLFWHWLLTGVILLIVELLTGSGFLLWIGLSAVIVSLLTWIFPHLSESIQFLSFALLAILTAISWRFYLKFRPLKTDKPTLNRRGEQYVGRIFVLDTPVVNGVGMVHVDDTLWRVRCEDLPARTRVRITGVDGVMLIAEKI